MASFRVFSQAYQATTGSLWQLGLGGALTVTLLAMLVCLPFGSRAVIGALLGGVMVMFIAVVTPATYQLSKNLSPAAVLATALGGYIVMTCVLGLALLLLISQRWLSSTAVGLTVLVGALVVIASQVWVFAHMRHTIDLTGPRPTQAVAPADRSQPPAQQQQPLAESAPSTPAETQAASGAQDGKSAQRTVKASGGQR